MTNKTKLPESDDDLVALQGEALLTEDGARYPAAAYAFVPDPEKPSTWRVRLWESLDKGVTPKQLGRATASFSPGGLDGERADVSEADGPQVRAAIREAYLAAGIANIPKWIGGAGDPKAEEPMTRFKHRETIALTEDAYDPEKGEVTFTVIKPGFNTSKSRFYPGDMLRRDCNVFEGAKMFADHPTRSERADLPERSVKPHSWVGSVKEVWAEADGTIRAKAAIVEDWMKSKLKNLKEHNILPEMGNSIVAIGEGVKTKMEGARTLLVERLALGKSIDFVTYAGAGGGVECYESEHPEDEDEDDVDLIDEKGLRERRPDLVEIIEGAASKAPTPQKEGEPMPENEDGAKLDEARKELKEAKENTETVEKERDELKGQIAETQRVEARSKAQGEISEILDKAVEAGLPKPFREKLAQQFKEAVSTDGVEDAIAKEVACLKEVATPGEVDGMAEGREETADESTEESRGALVKSFKDGYLREGKSDEDAERLAKLAANCK